MFYDGIKKLWNKGVSKLPLSHAIKDKISFRISGAGVLIQVNDFDKLSRLERGNFVPIMSVAEMRNLVGTHGLGVGTLQTDQGVVVGEVTVVDGVAYCTSKDGSTRVLRDEEQIYFAQVGYFEPIHNRPIHIKADSQQELVERLKQLIPDDQRHAFVFKVNGKFDQIKVRSVDGSEESSYGGDETRLPRSLAEIVGAQKEYNFSDEKFTLAGVFNEKGVYSSKDIPYPGIPHMHGISIDRQNGGHVLDFKGFDGEVEIMPVQHWLMSMPKKLESGRHQLRYAKLDETNAMPVQEQIQGLRKESLRIGGNQISVVM